MKIFLLSQSVHTSYDTYDSCVVVSENEDKARCIFPSEYADTQWDWAKPEDVTVTYIGEAKDGLTEGTVICASFNAG